MIIFQAIRRDLTMIGIQPATSTRIISFNAKLLSGFLVCLLGITSSALFLIYSAVILMEFMQCFCILTALISLFLTFSSVVLQNKRLFNYIETMEELINKRLENPTSKAIHAATNRQVEKICRILYIGTGFVFPQFVIWPKFMGCFVIYFTTDLGDKAFQLPFPLWMPFKWDNPIGYTIAASLECILITYVFFSMMIMVSIGVASYLYELSLTRDIKSILYSIDKNSKLRKNRPKPNLYEQFIEFIEIHSAAKQSMTIISKLLQPVFMVLFPRTLLALCWAMLLIQLELSHRASYGTALLLLAYDAINSLALIIICCELSQRISEAFDEINATIDQFKWYLFSIKLKRILPSIMIVTQEPMLLECFGSISCCREVFKKILNSAFSYFMVLRQFIK